MDSRIHARWIYTANAGDSIGVQTMTAAKYYPSDNPSFEIVTAAVERVLQVSSRLPEWPFRVPLGNADFCQFSLAIEGPFGAVLEALVDTHGDASVSLAVLDPSPMYYRDNYGSYPVFTVPAAGISQTYWHYVTYEPNADPTGAVAYTANVVGVAGNTGAWAVWAERSWDMAIVMSQIVGGPWTSVDVDFVSAEDALAHYTEPNFKIALQTHERATFLDNVRKRGTIR